MKPTASTYNRRRNGRQTSAVHSRARSPSSKLAFPFQRLHSLYADVSACVKGSRQAISKDMFRRLKTAHDNTLQHLTVEAQRDLYAHLPLPSRLTSLASNPLRVPGQTEDQHTACCPSDEQPRMKVQQHGMREAEMLQSTMAELTTTLAKTEAVLVDLDREWVALRADTLRLKQDYLQFEKDCDPDTAPHSKIRSPEDLLDDLAQYIKAVKKEISADVDDGGDADATDMWQRAVGDVLHDVGLERKLGEYVDRMSEKALREIESEEKEAKKREREMHNQIWRLVRVEVESK